MTIPRLPGFDETIAPGIAAAASAISDIVRPYHRIEVDLRRQIQRDPRIATQLADMEYANPGSTGKVFGPNVENYAKALAPSIEARINKKVSENVEGALADPKALQFMTGKYLGFQPSEVAKEGLAQTQLKTMESMLATNPELGQDAAFTQLMGTTRARYENEQAELSATRGAEDFLSGRAAGMSPYQILDAVLGKEVTGPDGKPFRVSTKEVGDLFQSPTYGNLFKTLFASDIEDRREANRIKMAQARDYKAARDLFAEKKAMAMIARSESIEGSDPAAVAAATLGMNDPSVAMLGGDPSDAGFQKRVDNAKEQIRLEGQQEQNTRTKQAQANVITQQKLLNGMVSSGAGDTELQQQLIQLNTALEETGKITGHVVSAAYTLDPERFFAGTPLDKLRGKGVYYFDENGQPIQESSVAAYVGGTGKAKPLEVPKADSLGGKAAEPTAGIPHPTSGPSNISAKTIFPTISDDMAMQMDRIATIEDKGTRQALYDKAVKQNPSMTDAQRASLKKLFKLD